MKTDAILAPTDNLYPSLSDLIPLFPTKAAAKRYRKQVIQYVNEQLRDAAEIEYETIRIRSSFPKWEPAQLGDDFIAKWHYVTGGGTTIRKNRRRELKRNRRMRIIK